MIDAHQHCWRIGENDCTWPTRSTGAIYRDYLPEDWAAVTRPLGVEGSVLVQSQESHRDTGWLLELAERHDFILGVVGWANLKSETSFPESRWLKGIRPMVQGRPSAWLDEAGIDRGLSAMAERGLVFDALIRPKHLPALRRLAKRHPRLRVVVNHGAKPEIGRGWIGEWKTLMADLAGFENVSCKLSGLLTEAGSGKEAGVAEIGAWLYHRFGADRLIWGSDWPVLEMAGDYAGWLALAKSVVPTEAHAAVFGGNARRVYGLE